MQICQFCSQIPAVGAVTHARPEGKHSLRLCSRCMALAEYVQLAVQVGAGDPCVTCGQRSVTTAEARDAGGQMIGKIRLCNACVQRVDAQAAALYVATSWTPGVVELPPGLHRRLFAAVNATHARPAAPPEAGARAPGKPVTPSEAVAKLQVEMEAAVAAENYERAAEVRDQIRRLLDQG